MHEVGALSVRGPQHETLTPDMHQSVDFIRVYGVDWVCTFDNASNQVLLILKS